jgi:superfamily II DNA or RNA helicase
VFPLPLTLQNISQLRDPRERVPLSEHVVYLEALKLIESGSFQSFEMAVPSVGNFNLQMLWEKTDELNRKVVQIQSRSRGPLQFSCSCRRTLEEQLSTCEHQWASYILVWQGLTLPLDQILNPELQELSTKLKEILSELEPQFPDARLLEKRFETVQLDSISLCWEERPLLKGKPLSHHLSLNFGKYKLQVLRKEEERLSPSAYSLPEAFRKNVIAYSEHYLHEVNSQNRMADLVRYNFSNGMQISAQDIIRHPLQVKVPRELLPQSKVAPPIFAQWPLTQSNEFHFVSQSLRDVEEVMQALLSQISHLHRRGQLEVYLQTPKASGRALQLKSIEFDPATEMDWRVEFVEKKKDLEAEFKLLSFRKQPLFFFESFALETTDAVLIVHPWLMELSMIQETISGISEDFQLKDGAMPTIHAINESQAKRILKFLRGRLIPVAITGGTKTIDASKSQTEIRLNDQGGFYLQHEARVSGQKNLQRPGWTSKSRLFMETLSQGLPFLLNTEARDLASTARHKRDWDIKLLKHLGILQFVFFETLYFYFEKTLSNGAAVERADLFSALHSRIHSLLIAGPGESFVRETPLIELCSRSVLSCFEELIKAVFKALDSSESFYSEHGEVVMEGLVQREMRLIFEMMKRMVFSTNGEAFQKSRTSFLSRVTTDGESFHFPSSAAARGSTSSVQTALESLQQLILHGYKIYFKDQPLQELQEDEFHIDFVLQTDADARELNWFELNPRFFLKGQEVEADQMVSFGGGGVIEYDGKIFLVPSKQMPSLRRLEHFWLNLQKGKKESSRKKAEDRVYHLPRCQTLELLALRSSGIGIRGDEAWKKLCEFYDNLGISNRELKLPNSLEKQLKPYQVQGIQWLQDLDQLRLGALLADDMGLGKTLQTLAFLDDLRAKGELGQVLVVVPSSLIFNWQQEVQKFTPELPLVVFSNRDADKISRKFGQKESMVVITTYGLLMEHQQFLTQYRWRVAVFDEAQNLKNITTKRTSAARSLSAQFKLCLTGTPMENHYGEFYSLVDLLVPGSLGDIVDFRRQFVTTEMISREQMQDLKLKIKPLLLRRTKKEILDQLPEKQETKMSIAFEERQKEIYRDIALSYNQKIQEAISVEGEASVQLKMLTAILRLRQACSDPGALPNIRYEKVPPKLETLLDSVREIVESGESALVFTQFLQTLQHTAELLSEAGIPVFVLHGGIPSKMRQKILSDFQGMAGGAVLVMTLKTGGVGLNLTKASYVFHLEPWWNPSVENQATGRAHRLGQSRAVQVFKYIMHESLEEKIEVLKDRKDRKFQALFAAPESEKEIESGGALSKEDFDFLLGVDPKRG